MPDNAPVTPRWKWYEKRITEIFGRVKDCKVEPNATESGQDSKTERQIDIRITVPLTIDLGDGFSLDIPVKIIVDCKDRKRAIDVHVVDEVAGLKDDVRAHLGIIVTPHGISKAAKERAKAVGIRPIVVTTDLIAIASPFPEGNFTACRLCEYTGKEEYPPPEVSWRSPVEGYCDWCNGLHFRCPECYEIFAITEAQYDQAIKCPYDCGSVFFAASARTKDSPVVDVEVLVALDATLLTAAYSKSTKRLTPGEVERIIERTRWQHWGEGSATIGVTEFGYMEYGDDDNLYLTEDGEEWARLITEAVYPTCY